MTEIILSALGILGGLALLSLWLKPRAALPVQPQPPPEPPYVQVLDVYRQEQKQRRDAAEQYVGELTEELQRQELEANRTPATEEVVDSLLELGKEVRDETATASDRGQGRTLH